VPNRLVRHRIGIGRREAIARHRGHMSLCRPRDSAQLRFLHDTSFLASHGGRAAWSIMTSANSLPSTMIDAAYNQRVTAHF
jgi:hypothetical protein